MPLTENDKLLQSLNLIFEDHFEALQKLYALIKDLETKKGTNP